jgi:group I intron endonuclease
MDTYKATNTTNGKFYIGSSTNFERRKRDHLTSKRNLPFQNALRKNPDAFEWEVWTDDNDEPILEQALLDMWYGTEQCYNLSPSAKHPPRPDKDTLVRTGRKVGDRAVKNKTGIHDPAYRASEEYLDQCRKVGSDNVRLGRGCLSDEYRNSKERKELYHEIGRKNLELRRGVCDPSYQASAEAQAQRERGAARSAEVCSKRVKLTSPDGTETFFKSLTEASVVLGVSKNTLMKYANNFPDKPMKKGAAKGSCIEYV